MLNATDYYDILAPVREVMYVDGWPGVRGSSRRYCSCVSKAPPWLEQCDAS